ncbi:hypothetical protein [Pantoea sp. ME81]|uniref:hypothetical protein n=1 Tax=Pantoea sp. ME81 TaxID=2743935 RepID=UPI0015F5E4B4|nr:hypothetical protein [Pantoea sp. ME81]
MISDERLEEIIYRAEMFGHGAGYTPDEIIPMAKELLTLRAQVERIYDAATYGDDSELFEEIQAARKLSSPELPTDSTT